MIYLIAIHVCQQTRVLHAWIVHGVNACQFTYVFHALATCRARICKTSCTFHFSPPVHVFPFSPFYCILCASLLSSVQYSGSEYLASLKGALSRSKRNQHGCARCRIRRVHVYLTELVASVISNCVVIRKGRRMTHPIARGNSHPCVSI